MYAYRPSELFAEAWRQNEIKRDAFIENVVKPWNAEHPDNPVLWRNNPFDIDCHPCGFRDGKPDDPPPPGLSRSKRRGYLIPRNGAPGISWRAVIETFNQQPLRSDVYRLFEVPMRIPVEAGDGSHFMRPVCMENLGGQLFVACMVEVQARELTPIKLSDYYLAKEAVENTASTS
jgi:hypothetical protein